MRILGAFLNPEVRTGGHRRYLELLSALAQKGHDVYLIKNEKLFYSLENVAVIDLDGNIVREIALSGGLVDVKVAAIDNTWSLYLIDG